MADDLLDNSPDDDDGPGDGIDLEGGSGSKAVPPDTDDDDEPDDAGQAKDIGDDKPAAKAYTQEDVDRLKEANRKERETVSELRRKIHELKEAQKPAAKDETAKAREEAAAAEVARLKPILVGAKAETLFTTYKLQNPTENRLNWLVGNLKMADIEIEDNGKIFGLEEQIQDIVERFPEMFTPPKAAEEPAKPKPKIPRGDGADRRPAPVDDSKLTTAQRIARRALSQNS